MAAHRTHHIFFTAIFENGDRFRFPPLRCTLRYHTDPLLQICSDISDRYHYSRTKSGCQYENIKFILSDRTWSQLLQSAKKPPVEGRLSHLQPEQVLQLPEQCGAGFPVAEYTVPDHSRTASAPQAGHTTRSECLATSSSNFFPQTGQLYCRMGISVSPICASSFHRARHCGAPGRDVPCRAVRGGLWGS